MPRRRTRFHMPWPSGGLVLSTSHEDQPRGTTVDCQNVRVYDPSSGRARGAQRAGLAKYVAARTADGNVQDMGIVVTRDTPADQTEVGARVVISYAVTGGTVAKFTTSGFTTATNGSSALSSSVTALFSTELFGVIYFADGASVKQWTASTNTVATWTAASGSLPTSGSNKPRLIETWRSRIVASGISADAHNWFMSKAGDATDWNYAPTTETSTQAVAGNNTDAGKSPDIINSMCPYNDDVLLFFGDHTIHQMTGDPAEGGRIDLVSSTIGGAWGRCWAKAPDGAVYFYGSRGGVYRMAPGGSPPESLTEGSIEEKFKSINMNTTLVRLVWSDREKGLYVFLTPLGGGATTNYFYDSRSNSWWLDKFATNDQNPISVMIFDGDTSSDRTLLLGGQDGYVRKFDYDTPADDDDGVAIDSYVWLGPIQLTNKPKLMLRQLNAAFDTSSNDVDFAVYAGESSQTAKVATAEFTGTWVSGRNKAEKRRATGHNLFIRLRNNTDDEKWMYEFLGVEIDSFDGPRARQW